MEIHESVQRIMQHEKAVAEMFYPLFLGRYPELNRFFTGVDMKRQSVLLTMTLMLVEHHFRHEFPATSSYLRTLGHQHQLRKRIPADAFPKFQECMLETLRTFHGVEWSETLEREWTQALGLAIQTMLSGYEDDSESVA